MKILVCGDRNWSNRERLEKILDEFADRMTLLIEGEARGADRMSREWAEKKGIPVDKHRALWETYGKGAGPLRNHEMLECNPDLVIAFHENILGSKGTRHMLIITDKAKIPYIIVTSVAVLREGLDRLYENKT